jgi:hypothetical protein
MTNEYKMKQLLELGYTYDPETGNISGPRKKILSTINDRYKMIRVHRNGERINVYHHQFAWFYIHGEVVECIDHINRDKLDNRIENLRSVTKQQNHFNINAKGYSYHSNGLYQARIRINGRLLALGYFKSEIDAHQAYISAKKTHHVI